jgi:hypothetical protein
MVWMSHIRRRRGLLVASALIFLCLAPGCSRPVGLRGDDVASQSDQHPVPFHEGDGTVSADLPSTVSPAVPEDSAKSENRLPFRDAQSLPIGTLMTVRLRDAISTDSPGPSGSFEAVIDEPVTVDGNTLVPRGARVAGRVESARASRMKRNRNYVRLTLDTIDVAGHDFAVQTSSLFARGDANEPPHAQDEGIPPVIHLEKGRRLTFRLTEPVYVAAQQTVSVR